MNKLEKSAKKISKELGIEYTDIHQIYNLVKFKRHDGTIYDRFVFQYELQYEVEDDEPEQDEDFEDTDFEEDTEEDIEEDEEDEDEEPDPEDEPEQPEKPSTDHLVTRIPQKIIDEFSSKTTHAGWKVFIFLCRRANFQPKHMHYGMCFCSYSDIAEHTGVSKRYMRNYLNQLEELGLIKFSQTIKKQNGKITTFNVFQINYFKSKEYKNDRSL